MNEYEFEGLSNAIITATEFHRGQVDKRDRPYILHPLELMVKFGDPKVMVVAVLHDVVEDTNCTLGTIEAEFGVEIRQAIDAITHRKGEPNVDYWKRCAENDLAFRVKTADMFSNREKLGWLEDHKDHDRLHAKYCKGLKVLREHRNWFVYDREQKANVNVM